MEEGMGRLRVGVSAKGMVHAEHSDKRAWPNEGLFFVMPGESCGCNNSYYTGLLWESIHKCLKGRI